MAHMEAADLDSYIESSLCPLNAPWPLCGIHLKKDPYHDSPAVERARSCDGPDQWNKETFTVAMPRAIGQNVVDGM